MKLLNINTAILPCRAYTDYPFTLLGDEAFKKAPMREVTVLYYDNDKYCDVAVEGIVQSVKAGYLYSSQCEVKIENKNLSHRHKDKPKGIKEINKKQS